MRDKKYILLCIEDQIVQGSVNRPDVQMIILDGSAIINMIKPGTYDSFNDYISTIMVYNRSQLSGEVVQVDIVFETYSKASLKAGNWQKRGKGTRRRVDGKNKVPGNWQEFLRKYYNNSELFYLSAIIFVILLSLNNLVLMTCLSTITI